MKTLLIDKVETDTGGQLRLPQSLMKLEEILREEGLDAEYCPVQNLEDLERVVTSWRPDLVFSAAYDLMDTHRTPVNINGWLKTHAISYVGSDHPTLDLVKRKAAMKWVWQSIGIQTPGFFVVSLDEQGQMIGLENVLRADHFPYIVKPAWEGGSRGIDERSIVFDRQALLRLLEEKLEVYPRLLVECYLGMAPDFREYTAAMIGSTRLVVASELANRRGRIVHLLTEMDKRNGTIATLPIENPGFREEVETFATCMLAASGVRDYARADFVFAGGHMYALEVNGLPLVPNPFFDACAHFAGLDEKEYLSTIILSAVAKSSSLKMDPDLVNLRHSVPGWVRSRLHWE